MSDSKYVIEGLTKHIRKWEQQGWSGIANRELFKTIIAWIRWRKGRTYLRWMKGHNGTISNKEVDRLMGEGAKKL